MSRPTLYWAKVVTLDGLRRSTLNQARHFIRDPMGLCPQPTRRFTLDQTGPCPGPTRLSTWTRAGTIPAPRQRLRPCILAESCSCTTLKSRKKKQQIIIVHGNDLLLYVCFLSTSYISCEYNNITPFSFEKGQMVLTMCH